jgi:hypothetical protein
MAFSGWRSIPAGATLLGPLSPTRRGNSGSLPAAGRGRLDAQQRFAFRRLGFALPHHPDRGQRGQGILGAGRGRLDGGPELLQRYWCEFCQTKTNSGYLCTAGATSQISAMTVAQSAPQAAPLSNFPHIAPSAAPHEMTAAKNSASPTEKAKSGSWVCLISVQIDAANTQKHATAANILRIEN